MKNKKMVGQFISIKFSDRKEPVRGFVIDHNEQWILMKNNPVDYVIDGCVIVRNKNIRKISRDKEEKFAEKILILKGVKLTYLDVIPLTGIVGILTYLTKYFKVFQFETKSEASCYLGKLSALASKHLVLDYLNPEGEWDGQMNCRPNDIRVIEYNTDYINSLKLVLADSEMKILNKELTLKQTKAV
jgi:hypothetical protein